VTLAQAALVAAGYWFTNSAFNANLGFNLLRWPLVAGMLALLGTLVLLGGAFYVGQREKNAAGALRFVVGFLVAAAVVDLLSLGRSEPLQLLAHIY
jgi:hypothetical protein